MADTNPTELSQLPNEVVTCLQNARFLHLATCEQNVPHVSLMNYTYLPSHPFPNSTILPNGPTIVMTTNPVSKKTSNLLSNPHVSLLVHDWVSTRPPSTATSDRERSPTGGPRSSLAAMLMQMNSTAVSSISATINGEARVLLTGTDEERWCKEQHLAANTFAESNADRLVSPGDGGRGSYIEDTEARVVIVRIKDGRISDWKGGVRDWSISASAVAPTGGRTSYVNGDIA